MDELLTRGCEIIVGKEGQLKLALCCLFAGGHLLIEDLPGVGKTTLAHLLSKLLGLEFQRLQFTSDMLPAEITGAAVYDKQSGDFRFHKGPIFTHLLLADEINRATPRAQSALLEAMEEQQVTAEGHTYPLPEPFFVVATQNPRDQFGTFELPESQLDRFLMRIGLGYPDPESERALLAGDNRRKLLDSLEPILDRKKLLTIQQDVIRQHVSPALIDYIQKLLDYSRHSSEFPLGLSPRAGLGLLQAAKSWSLLLGRNHVLPEDVQAVLDAVTGHRLGAQPNNDNLPSESTRLLLEAVPIP
ncbi:MAG: AAA family ATPase [Gammaproteobacteria bacterium]